MATNTVQPRPRGDHQGALVVNLPLAPGQDYALRFRGRGFCLPRTTCRRGGAVRSARQVKRGCTAVPDIDGSAPTRRSLLSKSHLASLHATTKLRGTGHRRRSVRAPAVNSKGSQGKWHTHGALEHIWAHLAPCFRETSPNCWRQNALDNRQQTPGGVCDQARHERPGPVWAGRQRAGAGSDSIHAKHRTPSMGRFGG